MKMMHHVVAFGVVVLANAGLLHAENMVFPSDAGVLNVRDFGAKGDGAGDDTAAINAAFAALGERRVLFFPEGVYLISDTLVFPRGHVVNPGEKPVRLAGTVRWVTLQGQSRDGTIIRLKDGCAGFDDSSKPKHMILTMRGNMAFDYTIANLTLDIGSGNPGASGIHYVSNNGGMVRDVRIVSSDAEHRGTIGIDMTDKWPGPAMVRRTEIVGFDCGIRLDTAQYGMTFEYVTLRGQRQVGLDNADNVIAVRGLRSENAVPAVRNGPNSVLTLVDSELVGGSNRYGAIECEPGGTYFIRNVVTQGYRAALLDGDRIVVASPRIDEEVSGQVHSAFADGSPRRSLNLSVEEAPEVPWDTEDNFAKWVNVTKYNAKPDDNQDDSEGIQKAFDAASAEGKTVVYFPNGSYYLNRTIQIGGSVRRVVGFRSQVRVRNQPDGAATQALRLVEGQPVVVFHELYLRRDTWPWGTKMVGIEHAAANTLVWTHGSVAQYVNTVSGGKAFFDDVHVFPRIKGPQQVWIRQWNPETGAGATDRAVNDGGTLWVLMTKTEGCGWHVRNLNGARTEMLGGLAVYPGHVGGSGKPSPWNPNDFGDFVNTDSSLSVAGWKSVFSHFAIDTNAGQTRDYWAKQFGGVMPLYVSP